MTTFTDEEIATVRSALSRAYERAVEEGFTQEMVSRAFDGVRAALVSTELRYSGQPCLAEKVRDRLPPELESYHPFRRAA